MAHHTGRRVNDQSPGPLRVVLTGSESVGKTTLAARLAAHFGVRWVPEFVRQYAETKGSALEFADHGPIARGQVAAEDTALADARVAGESLLLHDTDVVSTVVYCHHYFGRCPAFLEELARTRRADLYLVLDIDVPWVADGVRDRGDRRLEIHSQFIETLTRFDAPRLVIRGDWDARLQQSIQAIDRLISSSPSTD